MTWQWFVEQVWPNLFASLLWVVPGYAFHTWHTRHDHAMHLADALDAAHRRLEEYAVAAGERGHDHSNDPPTPPGGV